MNKKSCKSLLKGLFILTIIIALLIFITNMNNEDKNISTDNEVVEEVQEVEGEETTDEEVENSDASYLPEE